MEGQVVVNVHLLCGATYMLVTAFALFGCCSLPPSPTHRERAASTSRVERARVCMYFFVCLRGVGVRSDALGANEYLVITMRVVGHPER